MKSYTLPCALVIVPLLVACSAAGPDDLPTDEANGPVAARGDVDDGGTAVAMVDGSKDAASPADQANGATDASAPTPHPGGKRWRFCATTVMREIPAGGTVLTLNFDPATHDLVSAELGAGPDAPIVQGRYDPETREWWGAIYSPNAGVYGTYDLDYGPNGTLTFSGDGTRFNGSLYEGWFSKRNVYGGLEDGSFRCDPVAD